jgi:hypothetical protein
LTTEYASKLKTTTNMSPVTVSTNMDKPKMVFAGVVAGAKIFVELKGEPAGSEAAAKATQQNRKANT